jgi:hypothetical protein
VQDPPRVPASRDPLVDDERLTTRAWFRFFSLLPQAIADSSLVSRALVQNSTGSTIFKGQVVGFAGVGSNNYISVAKYLADGSTPSLYLFGVMAETLPDSGSIGLVTVWGHVGGIDTSAFSVGDILYASPTVAGGFTNVKPTAPDNVIPVAAVLKVGVTDGEIFVRPTIEQEQYYGEFSRTTNLTAALINTAYAIALTNTEVAGGVVLQGSPLDQIKVPQSGLYLFTVRYQVTSTNSSPKNARFWFRRNGTADYANSTAIVSLDSNNGYATTTVSETFSLAANDYIQLMWAVSDTALSLAAAAATGYAPAAASVLLTVTQAQQ